MRGLSSHRHPGRVISTCLLLALVVAACAPGVRPAAPGRSSPVLLQAPPAASLALGAKQQLVRAPIPFPFEENHGQSSTDAAFLLRAGSLRAGFAAQSVRYTVLGTDPDNVSPRSYVVEQELVGARAAAPVGSVPAPTRVNYLKGPADHWLTDLPTYSQLERTDAWPGIDVRYERAATGPKSTYVVA